MIWLPLLKKGVGGISGLDHDHIIKTISFVYLITNTAWSPHESEDEVSRLIGLGMKVS